jgi:hypothetical protein
MVGLQIIDKMADRRKTAKYWEPLVEIVALVNHGFYFRLGIEYLYHM